MGQARQFLDKVSNDERFYLPLPFMWAVDIDAGSVVGDIQSALSRANIKMQVESPDSWNGSGSSAGCLVAQEVTLPNESAVIANIGMNNRGGAMPGYGVVERTDFLSRSVTVNFIETDNDITDKVFRPWIAALGTVGLIDVKLRGNALTLYQYGKDGSLRKTMSFKDFFPTNCEGYTINYDNDDFTVKTVSFAYKDYSVE